MFPFKTLLLFKWKEILIGFDWQNKKALIFYLLFSKILLLPLMEAARKV
jgi:hypothetical protein